MIQKATRGQTRTQNRQLVLKTIYHREPISRAQIARATRLTRPTVSEVVTELMARHLVREVGYGPSTGGKPPMLLSIDPDAHHIVALDLSRTDFRGAVIDLRGRILHREHRPLQQRDGGLALDLVHELLDALMAATDKRILGIGVGAPGLIDAVDGVIVHAVNLDWHGVPLRHLLEERYAVPVYLANDCQAAALGEYTFGNSDGVQDLVVISVEWGIGAGIVLNGELFHGNPLGAGEIGHVTVVENGRRCTCGNRGCLETVANAESIIRRVQELLRLSERPTGDLSFQAVCEMAEDGSPEARQAIREAARGLGIVAASLAVILGGCHIRLTGQLTCLGEPFLAMIREEMRERALTALAESTEIGYATLGSDIMLTGSAAILLTQELGVY